MRLLSPRAAARATGRPGVRQGTVPKTQHRVLIAAVARLPSLRSISLLRQSARSIVGEGDSEALHSLVDEAEREVCGAEPLQPLDKLHFSRTAREASNGSVPRLTLCLRVSLSAAREAGGRPVRCDRKPGHACRRGGVLPQATRRPQGKAPQSSAQSPAKRVQPCCLVLQATPIARILREREVLARIATHRTAPHRRRRWRAKRT